MSDSGKVEEWMEKLTGDWTIIMDFTITFRPGGSSPFGLHPTKIARASKEDFESLVREYGMDILSKIVDRNGETILHCLVHEHSGSSTTTR